MNRTDKHKLLLDIENTFQSIGFPRLVSRTWEQRSEDLIDFDVEWHERSDEEMDEDELDDEEWNNPEEE